MENRITGKQEKGNKQMAVKSYSEIPGKQFQLSTK